MKPNIKSVNKYLPKNISISKYELSECSYIMYKELENKRKLDRELDSKKLAGIYLDLVEKRNEKIKKDKITYNKVTNLYKICIPFKVDCYAASCRFMEYKFSTFIECPDRIPSNPKYNEKEGYWYNRITDKTGYFEKSCADICKDMGINNHEEYIVDNLLKEFKIFITNKHKILDKYFKRTFADYSHLAYNGVTDDF